MSDINKENNDRLEEFLKGAFQRFEATPTDAVWGRLSQNLHNKPGDTPLVPVSANPTHKYWWTGVILAVLLFFAQYAYFNHQFKQLKQDMEKQQQTIESMASMKNTSEAPVSSFQQGELAGQVRPGIPSASSNAGSGFSSNPPALPPASNSKKSRESGHSAGSSTFNSHNEPLTSIKESSEPTFIDVLSRSLSQSEPTVDSYSDKLRPTKLAFQPVIIGSKAVSNKLWSENANVPRLHLVTTSITTVHRDAQPITVGWRIATAVASSKVEKTRPPFGPPPGKNEDVFVQDKSTQGKVFMAGITLQKTLSRGWSAVSGIDYTTITTEKIFNPAIRFKERDRGGTGSPPPPPPPGNSGANHDFNYLIGTGSGTYMLGV